MRLYTHEYETYYVFTSMETNNAQGGDEFVYFDSADLNINFEHIRSSYK